MKKCPYCAEEIQDEAILCRFCKSDLSHKGSIDESQHKTEQKNQYVGFGGWLLILEINLVFLLPALCGTWATLLAMWLPTTFSAVFVVVLPILASFGSIWIGYSMWKMKSYAIPIAKLYFLLLIVLSCIEGALVIFIPEVPIAPQNILGFGFGLCCCFLSGYVYLQRSQRIRSTYFPDQHAPFQKGSGAILSVNKILLILIVLSLGLNAYLLFRISGPYRSSNGENLSDGLEVPNEVTFQRISADISEFANKELTFEVIAIEPTSYFNFTFFGKERDFWCVEVSDGSTNAYAYFAKAGFSDRKNEILSFHNTKLKLSAKIVPFRNPVTGTLQYKDCCLFVMSFKAE